MKKVLSVAMASAMVLGMGANAFAIQYNTGSNDTAEWPEKFRFAGELFVTDKDGKVKKDSSTAIKSEQDADFAPGDVIWMPLYADGQLVYENEGGEKDTDAEKAVTDLKVSAAAHKAEAPGGWATYKKGNKYYSPADHKAYDIPAGTYVAKSGNKVTDADGNQVDEYRAYNVTVDKISLAGTNYEGREYENVKYYVGASRYNNEEAFKQAVAENGDANAYITVDVKAVEAETGKPGNPVTDGKLHDNVIYTGNIDKDWSINLIEKDGTVNGLVEKAELYKATAKDAKTYSAQNVVANGVYLKVILKDEWKSVKEETVKYYVYVSENGTNNKTNEVWVSGTYKNSLEKEVSFKWTNNANTPAVWVVPKGAGNGVAVFDYNDKAFFTVKMYEGEKLYLDLGTAYDRAISNEIYDASGAEVEAFYNFITADANFSRTGELVLVTDDDSLVPYQVDEDGNLVEVDAEYVKGYQIAHTNEKVNGFKFSTKELGNYILSEEIVVEEEEPAEPEVPETPAEPEEETPAPETEKPNPNTGAEDFVGLAVSLAVVSVAAAGALALKK